jgi:hypothetical protein
MLYAEGTKTLIKITFPQVRHWHLVYPFEASDRRIVDKDRRGELFYYMHQQVNISSM